MIYWWLPFAIIQGISILLMWWALITLQIKERTYTWYEFIYFFVFMIIWELMWGFYELTSLIKKKRKANETP